MNTTLTLTKTQRTLREQALQHPAGHLRLPETLRGGPRKMVLNALITQGLICGSGNDWHLTATAYAALGQTPPEPEATDAEAAPTETAAPEPNDVAPRARKTRDHTKQATVIQLLQRPEGATLAQLAEATQWQVHTIRGCLAGALKKKLGLTITSDKVDGGERTYYIR